MTKEIFEYHNGDRQAKGDPLAILGHLWHESDGRLEEIQAMTQTEEGGDFLPHVVYPAMVELAAIARDAFKMADWNDEAGAGASDEDCLGVLADFWKWLDESKKNIASTPT